MSTHGDIDDFDDYTSYFVGPCTCKPSCPSYENDEAHGWGEPLLRVTLHSGDGQVKYVQGFRGDLEFQKNHYSVQLDAFIGMPDTRPCLFREMQLAHAL